MTTSETTNPINVENRTIRAVLFDYGLVLSGPPDPAALQTMEQLLRAEGESFQQAYWKFRDDYDRGILSGTRYWKAVAAELGRPLSTATLAGLIVADTALWTQPNQPMIDWARSLQRAGFRTGILSNLGDAMETGICARFEWMTGFHHRTFSHRLGIAKPDPAIYGHAAEGLDLPPDQILFIDDREANIRAAQQAGMNALVYSDHTTFLQALRSAHYTGLPLPD